MKRDFKESTIKNYILFIQLFFEFLILSDTVKENPANGLEIISKPQALEKQLAHFYTYEEILRRYLDEQRGWVSYAYAHQLEKHLNGFFRYLVANEIKSVYSVSEVVLLKYREYLWEEFIQAKANSLVVKSQIERLQCVCRLFRYLYKEGILKDDSAKSLAWKEYYQEIKERAKNLPQTSPPQQELTQMDNLKLKFLDYELARGKAPKTVKQYKMGIDIFFSFLKQKGVENLAQVNKRLLLDYYLESIRYEDGLLRTCMNEKEVFEIIEQPRLNGNPLTLRDKAIMEVLFSTAIRSNELCSLNLEDIDQQQELVRIDHPKGGKTFQRVIPIGKTALDYLNLYLQQARPRLKNGDPKALFLSYRGHRLNNDTVLSLVKKYRFKSGLRKNITTHSFRVTCATLMLKNGADIRYVQEQLGHKRITSTQIYTRLTPIDLKRIHSRTHPRERKNLQGQKESSLMAQNGVISAGVIDS